jgi:hypothetical protein
VKDAPKLITRQQQQQQQQDAFVAVLQAPFFCTAPLHVPDPQLADSHYCVGVLLLPLSCCDYRRMHATCWPLMLKGGWWDTHTSGTATPC